MLTPEAVPSSKDSITTLIVGANRGIGLELARGARGRGHRVLATCRKPSEHLEQLGVRIIEGVDVSKAGDLAHLDGALEGVRLDRVIVNAGILKRSDLEEPNFDAVLRQFEVNAMGPLRVASAIHRRIDDGGKFAILTSRMGSIADNDSGGSYGYRMSKAAVNAAGMSLARDLAERSIAVALLHPGYVKTDMTGHSGHVTPEEAASMLLDRVDDLDMDHTGVFWHANGEELPW